METDKKTYEGRIDPDLEDFGPSRSGSGSVIILSVQLSDERVALQ